MGKRDFLIKVIHRQCVIILRRLHPEILQQILLDFASVKSTFLSSRFGNCSSICFFFVVVVAVVVAHRFPLLQYTLKKAYFLLTLNVAVQLFLNNGT